ncbi:MAG: response regulator [bacterium]|nr:response regulator [bacterium]
MNRTILLVDDDAMTRRMLQLYCARNEYDVVEAEDGQEALRIIDEKCPDLAIIDVQLPGINGFATARKIRTKLNSRQLPILFLTTRVDARAEIEGVESGAQMYLNKPIRLADLLAHIKELTTATPD